MDTPRSNNVQVLCPEDRPNVATIYKDEIGES